MQIINSYDGCSVDSVMKMTEQELREAIIRVLSIESIEFSETDSWSGSFILPDKIADAFRGKM